jgi:hypothetical protein
MFKTVPSHIFYNAPKLHTGLLPNEYPAILDKRETVLTPEQLAQIKGSGGDVNTISINVPVSVDANTKLASRLRVEVEGLIKEIMREEMR